MIKYWVCWVCMDCFYILFFFIYYWSIEWCLLAFGKTFKTNKQCVYNNFMRQFSQFLRTSTMASSQTSLLLSVWDHFTFTPLITMFSAGISFHAAPQTLTLSSTIPSDTSLSITPSYVSNGTVHQSRLAPCLSVQTCHRSRFRSVENPWELPN